MEKETQGGFEIQWQEMRSSRLGSSSFCIKYQAVWGCEVRTRSLRKEGTTGSHHCREAGGNLLTKLTLAGRVERPGEVGDCKSTGVPRFPGTWISPEMFSFSCLSGVHPELGLISMGFPERG